MYDTVVNFKSSLSQSEKHQLIVELPVKHPHFWKFCKKKEYFLLILIYDDPEQNCKSPNEQ